MLRPILAQAGLSNRESEVAALVATGLSNKEVADLLFVTEKTIKFHLTNIYKKMSIRSRAQLIVWCLPHIRFDEGASQTTNNNALNTGASIQNQIGTQSTQAHPVGGSINQNTAIDKNHSNDNSQGAAAVDGGISLPPGQYNPGGGSSDVGMGGGAFGVG